MAVVLADILKEEQVVLEMRAVGRDEAFREVIAVMKDATTLSDPEKFFGEMRVREDLTTTYMGNGIAFPHARTELAKELVLGIGRSREGVIFGNNDARAHLIFVIAVPRRLINDYLVCVGALARLTRDEKTRLALMRAATAAELVEILRDGSLLLE